MTQITDFLNMGGPAMWAIAGLSVLTLAMILWKLWQLSRLGAWRVAHAERAVTLWDQGHGTEAMALLVGRRGVRSRVVHAAMDALSFRAPPQAQEETARVARAAMAEAREGLRVLELVMTIAPLIGLLGTVLGMIDAFQALQQAGNRADPAALAGGIWEALLTTAAGMGVAIPAGIALSWFDSIADRLAHDLDDLATRLFLSQGR
ncbi:MotA/TolQ/ExbB proton channel family protein [Mesobacterium sp. TK19101]|uniref:MotA/TolQ/ExbB proton channel family protein n=1 Tax=Mesobacterium hydrothermale TaxID=3111907 RepID=A0ABU6HCX1_9RHOB|nr:MotA/TolQ/ExbB proton channel family protein [Mesobacterium sp. TK19101]MEC3859977.1 MotA/TolQ/ExbB proton channel family protein [Mesobacterium sp. TK19101]